MVHSFRAWLGGPFALIASSPDRLESHVRWLNNLRRPRHGEQLRDWNTAQVCVRDADDARKWTTARSAGIRSQQATLALTRICARCHMMILIITFLHVCFGICTSRLPLWAAVNTPWVY